MSSTIRSKKTKCSAHFKDSNMFISILDVEASLNPPNTPFTSLKAFTPRRIPHTAAVDRLYVSKKTVRSDKLCSCLTCSQSPRFPEGTTLCFLCLIRKLSKYFQYSDKYFVPFLPARAAPSLSSADLSRPELMSFTVRNVSGSLREG